MQREREKQRAQEQQQRREAHEPTKFDRACMKIELTRNIQQAMSRIIDYVAEIVLYL